jgi:hypothetical protein
MEDADDLHHAFLLEDLMNDFETGNNSVPKLRVVDKHLAQVRMSPQSFNGIVDLKNDLSGFDQVALLFNLLGQVIGMVHLIRKSIEPFAALLPHG